MSVKAVIFDLDGTLADTLADIAESCRTYIARYGDFSITDDIVRQCVGGGARKLLERLYSRFDVKADAAQDEAGYRAVYAAHSCERSALYPGAAELLAELKKAGAATAIATMKPKDVTKALADSINLHDMVQYIYAFEDMPRPKPDAWVVHDIASKLGIDAGEIAVVGDSAIDVLTAKSAGAVSIAVKWGYGSAKALRDANADAYVSDMDELKREIFSRI